MSYEATLNKIKNKEFAPLYILEGDESYFIDQITEALIDNVLSEEEKEFNQTIVYGKDTDPKELLNVIKRFPLMSEYQLVVLKEAQEMRSLDDFAGILENPIPTTIFVIALKKKKLDKRKSWVKKISKQVVHLNFAHLKENQLAPWINGYVNSMGISIDAKSIQMLIEFLGSDLVKLTNEIEKLKILLKGKGAITPELIERNIGISKDFNVWELQDALGEKNHLKAHRIINHFAGNLQAHPFELFIPSLYSYFVKLIKVKENEGQANLAKIAGIPPYFLGKLVAQSRNYSMPKLEYIISVLSEYDLRKKGVNNGSAEAGALMQEVTIKILN